MIKLPITKLVGNFSDFILLVTFFAILWYSFETRELKIETQKQLEPIPILLLDSSSSGSNLLITNKGETPVLNLVFKPILINESKFEFNLFRPIYALRKNVVLNVDVSISKVTNISITRIHPGQNNIENTLIPEMQKSDINRVEFILEYDSVFEKKVLSKYIFDISGYKSDPDDSLRIAKVYPSLINYY